jgi:hypothetical protein
MTQHQKLDLLEAEDIDEIYHFSEMLTDYFLTTDEILMNIVKEEDDD